MTVYSAAILMFLVMDSLGNIPAFLSVLKDVDPAKHKKIIVRELFIALGVLLLFMFTGEYLLGALQISESALTISGGIILFIISIKMIFPSHEMSLNKTIDEEPFIVPLAIPFVAGPSAIATVMLVMSREPTRWLDWIIALLIAWVATSIILFLSADLRKILKQRGLIALERLMGMVLTTVSVQMFMTGLADFIEK